MTSYPNAQGAKSKDLSDPGIAQEIAAEAAEDIQTTVYETADQIATKAGRAAETICTDSQGCLRPSGGVLGVRLSLRQKVHAAPPFGCAVDRRRRGVRAGCSQSGG